MTTPARLVPLTFGPGPGEVLWSSPGQCWTKPPPALLLDLSDGALPIPDLGLGPRRSQPRRLERFQNAHLTWTNFVIQDGHCTPIYDGDPRGLVESLLDWPGMGDVAGLVSKPSGLAACGDRLDTATRLPGPTLLGSAHELANWGMWLTYTLPAVQHFIENRGAYRRLLVTAGHPNMVAMLHLMGLTPADYTLHDATRTYWCEELHMLRQARPEYAIPAALRTLCAGLRARVGGAAPAARRIYAGRRRRTAEGAYRPLLDEDALAAALAALGCTEADPEYLTPEEQIATFAGSDAIVALGGAGLFNAMFARPGTRVVTIESTPHFLPAHTDLLASCALPYGIVIGQIDRTDPTIWNKRWTLRVPEAAAAVAEYLLHP